MENWIILTFIIIKYINEKIFRVYLKYEIRVKAVHHNLKKIVQKKKINGG